jgi:hypothetical protein
MDREPKLLNEGDPARGLFVRCAWNGEHSGSSDAKPKSSYLDAAVHTMLDPAFRLCGAGPVGDEVKGYAKGFIKAAPLFMTGTPATFALVSAYVADEAKVGDSTSNQMIDSCLGASKALLLQGTFSMCEANGLIPGATGVTLGITARTVESGLTRANYYDQQGRFCLQTGLSRTGSIAFNPTALAVDALCYGVADAAWSTEFPRSSGRARNNPIASRAITGATMGVSSGFGNEFYRQLDQDGKLDWTLLTRRSLCQGAVDGLAGGIGGWQTLNHLRLPQKDSAGALEQARATPFQKGLKVDTAQKRLRDGLFIPDKPIDGLTTQAFLGKVKDANGCEIPTIFRPDNGTPAFANRMHAEIGSYGLSRLGWFEHQIPVTVARKVKIGDRVYSGFIQETCGSDLSQYFKQMAAETGRGGRSNIVEITDSSKASQASPQQILEIFRANPALQKSYAKAWLQRMIIAEWDNHAMNMTADTRNPAKPVVVNIDLDGALKPAITKLDLVPQPGIRSSWEATNSCLYRELAGTKISPENRQHLWKLLETYDTAAGRLKMHDIGLTPMQAEGVLGRTRWFAENGVMPVQQEPLVAGMIPVGLKRTLKKLFVGDFAKPLPGGSSEGTIGK